MRSGTFESGCIFQKGKKDLFIKISICRAVWGRNPVLVAEIKALDKVPSF